MNNFAERVTPILKINGEQERNVERILTAESDSKRYVHSCPWGMLRRLHHCDKMPVNLVCDTGWCWELGQKAMTPTTAEPTAEQIKAFQKFCEDVDDKTMTDCIDEYLDSVQKAG